MAFYWNPLGAWGVLLGGVFVALAALVFLAGRARPQPRALALVLLVESTGGLLGGGLLYLTTDPATGYAAQFVTYLGGILLTATYVHFLATLPSPAARLLRSWPVRALVAAYALVATYLLFARTDLFFTGVAPAPHSRWESVHGPYLFVGLSVPTLLVLALGLLVALSMWRRAPRGSILRKQGAAYAVAFGWRDLNWAWFLIVGFGLPSAPTWIFWVFSLTSSVFPLALVYALLKYHIFDMDLRVKWTLEKSTVAAAFVGAFFVATEAAQEFLGERLGSTYVGIVAAGGLVFFLAPLQRLADRIANAAMPRVQDTEEYRTVRKGEVYRAAVESALEDGDVTEKERAMLATLAVQLGLDPREAYDLEREARTARAASGA